MKEYITSYETTADYEAVKDTLATPHIAMVDEDMSIHYQKYVPVIRYTASAKLTETTDSFSNGLHTNAFNATIVSHTFENGVGDIEFDSNVTFIGESAFRGCSGMTGVTLPDTVETISLWAFYECTHLVSITIPNSVTSIGAEAFSDCVGLRNITIPRSVTSIGMLAFNNCTGLPVTNYIRYADTCAVAVTNKNLTTCTLKEGTRFIGSHLFYGCGKLVSVTIPKSVIDIGSMAFNDCNALTNITVEEDGSRFDSRDNCNAIIETSTNTLVQGCKNTIIPNTVTSIGESAFSTCAGLTSIAIPNSVTSIGNEAFYNCSNLTNITIPNSVTNIGFAVFSGCTSLPVEDNIRYADTYAVEAIDKTLTSYTLKQTTKYIGDSAFENCTGLTSIGGANSGASIQMPNSVTHIEEDAFKNCTGLTSITIPVSIRSIAHYFDEGMSFYRYSFLGCSSLISITVDGGNPIYDSRNGCNAIIEKSTNTLILGCKNTVIPNTVTSIAPYSFYKCSGLTDVTIPNSVTSIGKGVFSGCTGLTSITCNAATAPTIQSSTFQNVKTGGTLTVPSGSTGYDVWMGTGNYYLGKYGWNLVENSRLIIYEASAKLTETTSSSSSGLHTNAFNATIVSHTFENGVGTIEFNADVTSIGDYAFNGCSGLTSVTIPNSVESIGYIAFGSCSGLTRITIPNGVTSIGNLAFHGCSGLTSIEIPNSVTSIGDEVFQACSGLTNITIGSGVTSIGYMAFNGCSGLTSITIPNSVTSIGELAFYGCGSLTSIIVENGNTVYDSRNNCNAIIETSTNTLIRGCKNTIILNSITSIGSAAFGHCSGLTSITIPNSVTSIGGWAFRDCSGLTSITCNAATAPTIQSNTFQSVKTGGTLTVPTGSTGYDVWMGTGNYYLGKYNWTKVEQ